MVNSRISINSNWGGSREIPFGRLLESYSHGRQADVFIGREVISGKEEIVVLKELNIGVGLTAGEADVILKAYEQYLTQLSAIGFAHSVPYRIELHRALSGTTEEYRIYLCEKFAGSGLNMHEELLAFEGDEEEFSAALLEYFGKLLAVLFAIPPKTDNTFTTTDQLLSVPMDFKPDNFVMTEAGPVMIDTYGPKLWGENGLLQKMPKIDEDFPLPYVSLLCGDIIYMVGRLYRAFNKIGRQWQDRGLDFAQSLRAKVATQAKSSGSFEEGLIDVLVKEAESDFVLIKDIYVKVGEQEQARRIDGI